MVEPLAVAWHAIDMGNVQPSDYVLVLGAGPIGLALILCMKARGISNIIVSEVAAGRKKFAERFGATHILDPSKEDTVKRCLELCDDVGVHVAFDTAGVQAGLDTAINAVRARGTIVNIAVWGSKPTIDVNKLWLKERTYRGIATYVAGDFQAVMDALSDGRIQPREMITKRIELDEVESEGFKTLIEDKANQVKILVKVAGGE
jgi:threonine dehydrogenase-like Zn-dependent dehydrogenase